MLTSPVRATAALALATTLGAWGLGTGSASAGVDLNAVNEVGLVSAETDF